ncbi:MAG: deoxyguanosinetriphosphate triphosphohydrolase [Burkholderiales bacterium]|nr:MAG: deoxyguanosinetriphosphate triphosphohydrolase [Burkholderiales bacterium]
MSAEAALSTGLAPYACHPSRSRGRRFPEPDAPTRTAFQRDRDRIIHSTAFRRLVYKTQVFLNHEGDLFRTRLTHSLEVAQLGRSMARSLRLNEDLVEAVALAHDLGHTPFGHAGQDALNACLQALAGTADAGPAGETWGFEHNLQSLRVVDALEERYPAFDGLNLCFETREGILKHCSRSHALRLEAREPGGVAARFLHGGSPSLEAQLCNLADEIAYNAHDIDDGVRSGLLTLDQLDEVPLFGRYRERALAAHPHLQGRRLLFESIRLMLSDQVYDVIEATEGRLRASGVASVDEVRQAAPLVTFSEGMRRDSRVLKQFLFRSLYRHPKVLETTDRARQVVTELFGLYMERPHELPQAHARQPGLARAVADYIAGMTDRFAIREHQRLSGRVLFP